MLRRLARPRGAGRHQTIDNQFAVSADGEAWWRPERRPNVPLAALGEWGGGLIWPFRTLTPDRDKDALHMYYSGTEGIHGDPLARGDTAMNFHSNGSKVTSHIPQG